MYIDVIFRNKSKMTNRLYSYYSSEDVEVGMRVIVPFGKSNINKLALVVKINDNPRKDIDYKEIISVVDLNPIVTVKPKRLLYKLMQLLLKLVSQVLFHHQSTAHLIKLV